MTIDRRVRRTRAALFDALVALVRERDYATITVADILARANVGRSTFYAHFTSKDDLLAKSLDRLRDLLSEVALEAESRGLDAPDTARAVSRALFEHVAQFRDVQLALSGGRGSAIIGDAIGTAVGAAVRDLPLGAPRGMPRELAVRFVVSTFTTVLRWWFDRRPQMSPAEADALLLDLVEHGLGRP